MNAYRLNKLWWFFGFLGMAIITGGSLMPSEPGPEWIPHVDKAVHFTGYFISTFYFQQLTKNQKPILIFILLFSYSGAIEIAQDFFPTRQMSLLDLIANGLGALCGSLLSIKILKDFLSRIDRILSDRLIR